MRYFSWFVPKKHRWPSLRNFCTHSKIFGQMTCSRSNQNCRKSSGEPFQPMVCNTGVKHIFKSDPPVIHSRNGPEKKGARWVGEIRCSFSSEIKKLAPIQTTPSA